MGSISSTRLSPNFYLSPKHQTPVLEPAYLMHHTLICNRTLEIPNHPEPVPLLCCPILVNSPSACAVAQAKPGRSHLWIYSFCSFPFWHQVHHHDLSALPPKQPLNPASSYCHCCCLCCGRHPITWTSVRTLMGTRHLCPRHDPYFTYGARWAARVT